VTPVGPAEIRAALDRSGALNPLLGIGSGDDGTPADRFAAGPLVDAVAGWLGTQERRVAASMVVLGYAARLVGPTLAVLLRDGILVDARPGRVRYAYHSDTGFRLSLGEVSGWRGPGAAQRWSAEVVDEHLSMVIASVRADTKVATALLWGNVASSVAATMRVLDAYRPDLLDRGPLRGSGRFGADRSFRRSTCCLYYRLDGGGTCGDCPLIHRRYPPRSG
jgi:ferric iron reductase protein FhuF